MTVSYTFTKEERLCSKKAITGLFENGTAFTLFPYRIYWAKSDSELAFPAQVAVSVSKKSFKKAVDRNRIKRLVKEAWRHNKHKLYTYLENQNINIILMLVYTSQDMPTQEFISKKTEEAVLKLLLILSGESKIQE